MYSDDLDEKIRKIVREEMEGMKNHGILINKINNINDLKFGDLVRYGYREQLTDDIYMITRLLSFPDNNYVDCFNIKTKFITHISLCDFNYFVKLKKTPELEKQCMPKEFFDKYYERYEN